MLFTLSPAASKFLVSTDVILCRRVAATFS